MYCLKCGKSTQGEQVFCDACLDTMDNYPVKSDVPIHLPNRTILPTTKKPTHRKRTIPLEEQIQNLRHANRRLSTIVLVLVVALGICAGLLAYQLLNAQSTTETNPSSGKNYTYSPD